MKLNKQEQLDVLSKYFEDNNTKTIEELIEEKKQQKAQEIALREARKIERQLTQEIGEQVLKTHEKAANKLKWF